MDLPRYNTARGISDLSMKPPFAFEEVVVRVFPLPADMFTLHQLCNRYLNFDWEKDEYRPALPYVFLAMINYGRLAPEMGNEGWVSQNEIIFAIALEWYRQCDGRMVFEDWAVVTPYIFVDNASSLTTGREVYGWPKVLAELTPAVDAWATRPDAPENVLTVSTDYIGDDDDEAPQTLLQIDRERQTAFSTLPPRPGGALDPALALPRWLMGAGTLGFRALEVATRSPLRGYTPLEPVSLVRMMRQLTRVLGSGVDPRLGVNAVNLKQFRDAEQPASAAYQAITRSRMSITRVNRVGLLGETRQFTGDLSGGFKIHLHSWPTLPLTEALGLEVDAVETHSRGTSQIVSIQPVMPFWVDVDIAYSKGKTLRWRTREIDWVEPERDGGQASGYPGGSRAVHPYNTARGGATEEILGPFRLPETTIRVLPLLADSERLTELCGSFFQPEVCGVEPWGSYVYLLVLNWDKAASMSSSLGFSKSRQVGFYIPVKILEPRTRKLLSVGLFAPFKYVDRDLAAVTAREINGWPALFSQISNPGSTWLADSGPARGFQGLLTMETDVMTAVNAGQELERRALVEIFEGDVLSYNADVRWRQLAQHWGPVLLDDLQRKQRYRDENPEQLDAVKALALEVLANGLPVNELSLKQFRDAERPDRACFQSIVRSRLSIESIFDIREIEPLTHVALYRYPTQPIVDTLGLEVKWRSTSNGTVVEYLEPIRPFWAKVSLRTDLAHDIAWRVTEEWQEIDTEPGYFELPGAGDVGLELVEEIEDFAPSPDFYGDRARRQNLRLASEDWRSRQSTPGDEKKRLTREAARQAVETVAEPQTAVESILSAEWENWGNPRWWQREGHGQQKPEFFLRADSLGSEADRFLANFSPSQEEVEGGGPTRPRPEGRPELWKDPSDDLWTLHPQLDDAEDPSE